MEASYVKKVLLGLATPEKAKSAAWFFKTGEGQYGHGDVFIGLTVPQIRAVAKQFKELPVAEIEKLLQSPEHEFRLAALVILVTQFTKADEAGRKRIYKLYLDNTKWVNNWDLVDSSAEFIVGGYLIDKDRSVLKRLAQSPDLWERRIAMLSTFFYIKQGETKDAFEIAEILIHDRHDLIQKAVGWMLREVGKRCSQEAEEAFLKKHYKIMPRTMLRYAIERFEPRNRQAYLKGGV